MTQSSLLKAALLGRPNVGKSTLFNRLIRSNRAITHDRPGITRDRMEGLVKGQGREPFILIDTGGVTLDSHARTQPGPEGIRGFEAAILAQAKEAAAESALLCLVVDGRDGLTPLDAHLAEFLRRLNKPLLLVVNKVDGPEKAELLQAEFHTLGFEVVPCSASHGWNVRFLEEEIRERLFPSGPEEEVAQALPELLLDGATKRQKKRLTAAALKDAARAAQTVQEDEEESASAADEEFEADFEQLPEEDESDHDDHSEIPEGMIGPDEGDETENENIPPEFQGQDDETPDPYEGPLRLALLGRPNAGKSSLVNAMVGKERMMVSDIAGTTRDSVDVATVIDGEVCTFVDTAGVRRRSKIVDTVERYSVNSSLKSTTKAHVTLLLLDASEGLAVQDKRLIDLLYERKTPFMVLVNKMDLVAPHKRKEAEQEFKEALSFCSHVPLLFISVKKKRDLHKIVPLARAIRGECGVRIGTGRLNRAMTEVLNRHQPPLVRQSRPKFFYLTQAESSPPTFVFFVSDADRVLASYGRYLEKSLRKLFGIRHAPMRVHFRSSHKKNEKK